MIWEIKENKIVNIKSYSMEKELTSLEMHIKNYQTLSIFHDNKGYDEIMNSLDKHIGGNDNTNNGYYILDGSDAITKFSNTLITDEFINVKEPDENDFNECMACPYLIIKGCEDIHPYLLDILDCSLLKGMKKYEFSGVGMNGDNLDGRTVKRRLFGNRQLIFLCDLTTFFIKNNGHKFEGQFSMFFSGEPTSYDEANENIEAYLDLTKTVNEELTLKAKDGYTIYDYPMPHYPTDEEISKKYEHLKHLKDLYSSNYFYSSSSFGSMSPSTLYIDSNFSEQTKEDDKRSYTCGLIEPIYEHIIKRKRQDKLRIILFAYNHRKTHFLEFNYNVAKKGADGYYEEPEYVLVRTKISNFKLKEYQNIRYEKKKGFCIFTLGTKDLVLVGGKDVDFHEINKLEESTTGVDSVSGDSDSTGGDSVSVSVDENNKGKSELDSIIESVDSVGKKGSKGKKSSKGKSGKNSYKPDKRISELKEFQLWKCKKIRLKSF